MPGLHLEATSDRRHAPPHDREKPEHLFRDWAAHAIATWSGHARSPSATPTAPDIRRKRRFTFQANSHEKISTRAQSTTHRLVVVGCRGHSPLVVSAARSTPSHHFAFTMAMSFAAISWAECLAVLLEERGGELRLQDFAQAYKARFGSAFRLATYGAESLESLCTGVEGIELVGTGADRLVRLARGRLPARRPAGGAVVIGDDDVTTATTTINSSSVVGVRQKGMAELKLRLHEVLKRYPGKTFSELKKLWPQEFRENLDLTKYNISGFNEFLIQLDSVCQIENGVLYPKFDPRMVETLIQVQRNSLISSKTYFDHGKIVAMVCNELGVKNFETLGMGR